jgi:hypothetical protein
MADAFTMMIKADCFEDADLGASPEDWHCIDCGVNTAPGAPGYTVGQRIARQHPEGIPLIYGKNTEVYTVNKRVWKRAGNPDGCLCIGCLEQRISRQLKRKDFPIDDPLNWMPGSPRLMKRQGKV